MAVCGAVGNRREGQKHIRSKELNKPHKKKKTFGKGGKNQLLGPRKIKLGEEDENAIPSRFSSNNCASRPQTHRYGSLSPLLSLSHSLAHHRTPPSSHDAPKTHRCITPREAELVIISTVFTKHYATSPGLRMRVLNSQSSYTFRFSSRKLGGYGVSRIAQSPVMAMYSSA